MKAMIFAAGLGKRLGDITKEMPKALVNINGKTILRMAVEHLVSHGFDEIIVNVHHFAAKIKDEITGIRKQGFKIGISDESDLLLETGGGLFKAKWFFGNEPFLLYNADIISDINLGELYDHHLRNKGLATLAVAERNDDRVFLFNRKGLLCGWRHKSAGEEIIARAADKKLDELAFSGIHIVSPEIFEYMEEGIYSMTALYLQLARSGDIYSFRHDNYFWADIGTPDDLNKVRRHFGG